jgi:putative tryptophan/tyrosine transport system substrate-binding protein
VASGHEELKRKLGELGWVEGRQIVFEARWAENAPERLPALAAELVSAKVDVVVASSTQAIKATREATSTIPIVMAASGDPVGAGFVASLGRPGGNITGLSLSVPELSTKRLQLLKEALPKLSSVAVLLNPGSTAAARQWRETEAAAHVVGVQLHRVEARRVEDLDGAITRAAARRTGALDVLGDSLFLNNSKHLGELTLTHRIAAIAWQREFTDAGGLLSYGPNYLSLWTRVAVYVDKILKGAKPADLPVEQPSKFDLVINLKTAKALGLTIPPSLLQRADEVIQ